MNGYELHDHLRKADPRPFGGDFVNLLSPVISASEEILSHRPFVCPILFELMIQEIAGDFEPSSALCLHGKLFSMFSFPSQVDKKQGARRDVQDVGGESKAEKDEEECDVRACECLASQGCTIDHNCCQGRQSKEKKHPYERGPETQAREHESKQHYLHACYGIELSIDGTCNQQQNNVGK